MLCENNPQKYAQEGEIWNMNCENTDMKQNIDQRKAERHLQQRKDEGFLL